MDVAVAQLIAASALALGSLCVAFTAMLIAYRQNFGWPPLLISTGYGLRTDVKFREIYIAVVKFEVWNRRRYPIVVRSMSVLFFELKPEEFLQGYDYPEGWHVSARWGISSHESIRLEPGAHHSQQVEMPFARRSLDDLDDQYRVSIDFFDPVSNKPYSEAIVAKYHFRS